MRPLKNAPPLPGGIFSLTPSRRDHNSHFRRARAITIFGLTDGVFTAGDLGADGFSGFPQTDRDETHRVYREIFVDNDIVGSIANFDFEPPLPPHFVLKFRFLDYPKIKSSPILIAAIQNKDVI